ncbi:hypothetical protein CBR_g38165 [Chara braunii]|uniref:UspA domain-containing protein n=1 Tax=Chara braunii TaxID=69332 RepID=A0A388LPG7_CHABU|nr:hypothetical protein CBR_g38165 [Chara braunii]|eukprot:GBG84194.1 hypothetical protein CBR_g38165 [Chara braunii]
MTNERRVVVAVDESEQSFHALRWAIDHVLRRESDTVTLLHVQQQATLYAGPAGPSYFVPSEVLRTFKERNDVVTRSVTLKAKDACDKARIASMVRVAVGDPRDVICEQLEMLDADLLIMGSRGLSAIGRTFLGSVSDYCVNHAKCPVVVVRKDARAKQ